MCTLIVATRSVAGAPLVIAANRDERLDRPAAPPALRDDRPHPVLAPRDLQAGGTWLGLNARGVFAGLTNRFGRAPDPARPSRGQLVLEALAEGDADAAADRVAARAGRDNPYHLVVADARAAHLLVHDGERLERMALGAGLHLVTERSFGAAAGGRDAPLGRRLRGAAGRVSPRWLAGLLAGHATPPDQGACVHLPELGYGTRSSTIVWLGEQGTVGWLHADGPPCVTAYRDLSAEAARLLSGPRPGG